MLIKDLQSLEGISLEDAIELQKAMSTLVKQEDTLNDFKLFCGVDVAYASSKAIAYATVVDEHGSLIDFASSISKVSFEYIPGLLFLREAKPMVEAIKNLKSSFDVLLVDGNGRLHPRKFGIACFLGILLDKPTIGVAKKLLCGSIQEAYGRKFITINGDVVGEVVSIGRRCFYVSVGHNISLDTATRIVKILTKDSRGPYPLAIAHQMASFTAKKLTPRQSQIS